MGRKKQEPDHPTAETLSGAEFDAALHAVGVAVTSSTVRRWAHERLVTSPVGTTRAARWHRRAVGDAAVVYRLRLGHPLFAATPEGVRVVLSLVEALLAGSIRWERAWRAESVELAGYQWRPRRSPAMDAFIVDGLIAHFKAMSGIPLDEPRSLSLAWDEAASALHVEFTAEQVDADGVGLGDTIATPPSRSTLRAIQRARLPEEVR